MHPHRGMEVEMIALRAWKLEGHPQVGWWVKVGDDTLDFEGGYTLKTDGEARWGSRWAEGTQFFPHESSETLGATTGEYPKP